MSPVVPVGTAVSPSSAKSSSPWADPTAATAATAETSSCAWTPRPPPCSSYHHAPHRHAGNGEGGKGDLRPGKNGETLVLPVPEGTVVKTRDGEILADLVGEGIRIHRRRRRPGRPGQRRALQPAAQGPRASRCWAPPATAAEIVLELKSVADVALVGYPSAGKSSLIAALSAARPKIADYPFTTLVPNLGVVQAGDVRYTVADVPGLIPGASRGQGPGPRLPAPRRALRRPGARA